MEPAEHHFEETQARTGFKSSRYAFMNSLVRTFEPTRPSPVAGIIQIATTLAVLTFTLFLGSK